MKNQDYLLHTQRKNNQSLSSVSSSTPVPGIFESRPFVVQEKQQENSQQADLQTSLMRADRYGHHIAQIKPAGISTTHELTDVVQQARTKTAPSGGQVAKTKNFGAFYGVRRRLTAYHYLTQRGRQGPHTVAHITKRTMAENAVKHNPQFDPTKLLRTPLMPSKGQMVALIRKSEKKRGTKFKDNDKKLLLRNYDRHIKGMLNLKKSVKQRNDHAVSAMELNLVATYSHGKPVTHDEIKGKGENRDQATADLEKLGKMKKSEKLKYNDYKTLDSNAKDDPLKEYYKPYARSVGTVSRHGRAGSPLAVDSEDESDYET